MKNCVLNKNGGPRMARSKIFSACLKVHNVFPKITLPPWLHPVKIWFHTVSR